MKAKRHHKIIKQNGETMFKRLPTAKESPTPKLTKKTGNPNWEDYIDDEFSNNIIIPQT